MCWRELPSPLAVVHERRSVPARAELTVAVVVAFFSASQDVVIDAYRIDMLPKEELGIVSSVSATVASVNRGDYCISKAGVAMARLMARVISTGRVTGHRAV